MARFHLDIGQERKQARHDGLNRSARKSIRTVWHVRRSYLVFADRVAAADARLNQQRLDDFAVGAPMSAPPHEPNPSDARQVLQSVVSQVVKHVHKVVGKLARQLLVQAVVFDAI